MRKLFKQDITEILYGATLLGGGGGGSLKFGLDMLTKLESEGESIELDLLELDEINDNEYGTMVAGLGSPVAMIDSKLPMFGPDAVYAFRAFQKAFKFEGKDVKYLYSGEMGGFNTFVPMLVAILSDKDISKRIKFLDTDGNGRAVPELGTSLNSMRGFPPYPMGLGNLKGDEIIVYPIDDHAGEVVARTLCMAYDMRIGFSTWGMNKNELKLHSSEGCITYAQNIGKAFLNAQSDKTDIMEGLKNAMPIREFCRGIIEKIDLKQEGGFDYGVTVIADKDGKKYYIDFKNENLVVRDDMGKAYITAPEVIGLIDFDNNYPLTNADTKVGMNLLVTLSPVDSRWWSEDFKAYECWFPELKKIGFDGKQIRF